MGANKNARRAAIVHLYFNIIGVTLFLVALTALMRSCILPLSKYTIAAWDIAIVHSVFNVLTTAVLLPFASVLEKLAFITIPEDAAQQEKFALLDECLLNTPTVCCAACPCRYG